MPATKPIIFSFQGFDLQSYKSTESYLSAIDKLYQLALSDFVKIANGIDLINDKVFSFSDYPAAKRMADKIISDLAGNIELVIDKGQKEQWEFANLKNDAFLESILDTSKVSKETLSQWQDRNLDALKSFQYRKINGLGLSDRVWNYSEQMKTQMELGFDIALGEGKSANELAKDLKEYLVNPDKLFRRVRNKHGNLVLSKNAKAFHPGQGKYRSSYKNAMRLSRTEINMAYREADQLRWKQSEFVVGFEVKLSNNHTLNGIPFVDVCDDLKGKYPKDFKFKGWHPQCRCHAVAILMDPDEFDSDELNELKSAINGTEYQKYVSRNSVTDVPAGFKAWVSNNAERSNGWKSQPFFIADNFKGGKISGGLNFSIKDVIKLPAGNDIYKSIRAVENDIRKNKTFETAVVFDDYGNEIFRKKGKRYSVSFSEYETRIFKDKIFTHNHPRGYEFPENSIKRIGNSFSFPDINTAISSDVKEIRAVTPLYTFIMKRPASGWPDIEGFRRAYNRVDNQVYKEYSSVIDSKENNLLKSLTMDRAEAIHHHVVWKNLCKELGIEYQKFNY